jgi:hypothetical protein
LMVIVLVSM